MITPPGAVKDASLIERAAQAIAGGASVIQLRDKEASDDELVSAAGRLLQVTRPKGIPLIINDRVNVAKLSGAEGLHLGQEDGSLREARLLLGEEAIIGRSTHSPVQALEAQAEGFDYVGIGPVFSTPTKPGYEPVGLGLVRFAAGNLKIPFVAIGGIDAGNVADVVRSGAKTVAVVRAVMGSQDPQRSARDLVRQWHGN